MSVRCLQVCLGLLVLILAQVCRAYDAENLVRPWPDLMVAGQPSAEDFARLAQEGVTTVINLRTHDEEQGIDGAELAGQYEMDYVHIPIAGAEDVNKTQAGRLHEALSASEGKALVYCRSGNRVGALLSLREYFHQGNSAENALRLGKSAGMSGLESHVTQLLYSE